MNFLMERLQTICAKLGGQYYSKILPIDNYQFTEGRYSKIEDLPKDKSAWKEFKTWDQWGGKDNHGWFRTKLTIPAELKEKALTLIFSTFETGWDAVNPQFFLYINGEMNQSLDMNHREVLLCEKAKQALPMTLI